MTGVEAVSNGVNAFRQPTQINAKRTLTIIIVLLAVFLGGHRGAVPGLQHRRHGPRRRGLPEHPLAAHLRGDGAGMVLLRRHRQHPRGAGAVGQHIVRGLPAPHPRDCDARLPAARLSDSRPPPALLARHLRAGRLHRAAADRLRRRHRSPDSALRHRSVSGLHALAGRDGGALAPAGGQSICTA